MATARLEPLEEFLRAARTLITSVVRSLESNISSESLSNACSRLEALLTNVNRMCTSHPECLMLVGDINEALDIVNNLKREQREADSSQPPVATGNRGRPMFLIPKEQLELLVEMNFTNRAISELLHVSEAVIKRRLREFNISRRERTSTMTDEELDTCIGGITQGNASIGIRNVVGQLAASGHTVQRDRVAEALVRVDAAAVALRWTRTIQRRTYSVPGPNSLWHIDGNHKLIRHGIVIHGGIDGYSRMITFLKASTNNRAETVLDSFVTATTEFGVPSRVRCDYGVENRDVATFMNVHRGTNRGSCITGRSVHNQRIERFWRDLYTGCTNLHKDLYMHLESEGVLNHDNLVHMWCFSFVFLPRLNRDIRNFAEGWNHHRLSSENGRTPMQLYIQGVVQNRGSGQTGVEDLFFEPHVQDETFPDGLIDEPTGSSENTIITPSDPACPLSTERLETFKAMMNPLGPSADGYGIDLYMEALSYCG